MFLIETSIKKQGPLFASGGGKIPASLYESILDEAQSILLDRVRKRFLAETSPSGVPWKQSRRGLFRKGGGYTYRNGRGYTGTGTLFETGTLFHSIQAFPSSEPFSRSIGTDVPYAQALQAGDGGTAWEFLGFSPDDLTMFEKLVLLRVKEALE